MTMPMQACCDGCGVAALTGLLGRPQSLIPVPRPPRPTAPRLCRWLHNALEHGWPEITIAFALGALLYQLIQVGACVGWRSCHLSVF